VIYCIGCPRKSARILNIFVEEINRDRKVQFSPHETATQKVFHLPFSIPLYLCLSSRYCSHHVHLVFRCPETDACSQSFALDRTSIVHTTVTVPLLLGGNRTILALFIFSIKMFKSVHSFSDILYISGRPTVGLILVNKSCPCP
jgi:hypothetical protein